MKRKVRRFGHMHGWANWDLERGWPTRERLRQLGLEDLYEPMVAGAEEARGTGHYPRPSAAEGRAPVQDFWAIDRDV